MEKSRYGTRLPVWRTSVAVAIALSAALVAACGDENAPPSPGHSGAAGSAGAAGAGHGGATAGRSSGGADAAGRESAAGESGSAGDGGSAGESNGGRAGSAGPEDGGVGAAEGGSADTGGRAGSGGRSGSGSIGGDAGDGAGGAEEDGIVGVKGGHVSDAAGDITLVIPPGALLGETEFSFAALAGLSSLPEGYVELPGTAHEISWSGAGFAANAVVTVGIRSPITLALERRELPPEVLLDQIPGLPVSGVSVCNGDALSYDVQPGQDSYEGQLIPRCSSSGGSGGAGGGSSGGGSGSVQVGLAQPEPAKFPSITGQPAGVSVGAGYDVSFTVTATGEAPLTYQWYRDGVAIPSDETNGNYYHLGPASLFDNGVNFSVSITNRFGTLTSDEARLDVSLPSAPSCNGPRAVVRDFGSAFGPPEVGGLTWVNGLAAWNDGGRIEVGGSSYGPVNGLSVPAQSAPQVLTLFLSGYVVFVDNDVNSTCSGSTGNRLMAVGISNHSNRFDVPNSAPFPLYVSQGDCIDSFSASLADPNPALLPDPIGHDSLIKIVPIVYALTEVGTGRLKLGAGGAGVETCGFCSDTTWEFAESRELTLPVEAACSGPARLGKDGMMGRFQTHVDVRLQALRTAALAWVSGENVCATTLDGATWSEGRVVFDNVVDGATPVTALSNTGDALVAASRAENPGAQFPSYRLSTAFSPAGSASWEFLAHDYGDAPSPISAAFTPSGDALVAWVRIVEDLPPMAVVRRHRSSGVWDDFMESLSTFDALAVGTGRPQLCVDDTGAVLALFEQTTDPDLPIQIWSKQWVDGFWSSASRVQDNAYAGTDASCERQVQYAFPRADPFAFDAGFVAWREFDPGEPSLLRTVAYGVVP